MALETTLTTKGHRLPPDIRRKAGIGVDTVITWTLESDGAIIIRKKDRMLNETQRHIRARAGTWDGEVSGTELLRRTRP